jgi:hypothetical protein
MGGDAGDYGGTAESGWGLTAERKNQEETFGRLCHVLGLQFRMRDALSK